MKYIPGYRDKVDNSCCSDTTSYDMKAAKKWNKWGIELSVIKDFIEECGGEEVLKGLTTRQVTDIYLKPIDPIHRPLNITCIKRLIKNILHPTLRIKRSKKVI